jgi:hypothetical protein
MQSISERMGPGQKLQYQQYLQSGEKVETRIINVFASSAVMMMVFMIVLLCVLKNGLSHSVRSRIGDPLSYF